jgi:hypothetical protein
MIGKIIKVFFTVIYSVLSFLNLHYTLLLALIGIVLHFTGTLESNKAVLVVYTLLLVLSIVYAIIASIKKLLGFDKRIKKNKGVQIMENPTVAGETASQPIQPQQPYEVVDEQVVVNGQYENIASEKPKYYRVRQNPNYVMAVYSNRYELYVIENGSLKKIRTDYK